MKYLCIEKLKRRSVTDVFPQAVRDGSIRDVSIRDVSIRDVSARLSISLRRNAFENLNESDWSLRVSDQRNFTNNYSRSLRKHLNIFFFISLR